MSVFLLHHHHTADECAAAYAAWRGFDSPLRHSRALSTCLAGGHAVWLRVEARDLASALAQVPAYVAARSTAVQVRTVEIP